MKAYELAFRFSGAEQDGERFIDFLKKNIVDNGGIITRMAPLRKTDGKEFFGFIELSTGDPIAVATEVKKYPGVLRHMFVVKKAPPRVHQKRQRRERPTEVQRTEQKQEVPMISAESLEEKLKEILKE